ncbi:NAD-dependent epimerase/dehydratase family protein [Gephyromycinifex aptenodytis]|uniref:NAD-dependent epimerase/dehydratase family protein n=1 Tax=Gephyromycinifex aptenodytis TaxID=2716227 RepID=UPI001D0196D9|nr:NAD-dependent epimerase/dehydratase family protein [Gephyromycinifex aptenodytis]
MTGGAGFIGSTLCRSLVVDNEILVYDDLRRNALKPAEINRHPRLKVIQGDVLDLAHLTKTVDSFQPSMILHLAAVAGIDTVLQRPTETMLVNMVGTANALSAAQSAGSHLERFVDFSTSEVFGSSAFRADELHDSCIGAVGEARWTYAVSKLAGEHLTQAFHQEYGLPTVSVRPFNIYGPGQVGEGAIKQFIRKALQGEDIIIHGDGNQIRAWCYIEDFIRGLLLCLSRPEAIGQSFNIGNARAVITVLGLAQTVVRVLGSPSAIRFEERERADIELRVPSVKKARDLLGFEAEVDLEDGIRRTAQSAASSTLMQESIANAQSAAARAAIRRAATPASVTDA